MGAATSLVSILLVGQAKNCRDIKAALRKSGLKHEVLEAIDCEQAKTLLTEGKATVIICYRDLGDDTTWRDLLEHTRETESKPSFVVCCRHASPSFWAEAFNLGAHDVLLTEPAVVHAELLHIVGSAHRNCPRAKAANLA